MRIRELQIRVGVDSRGVSSGVNDIIGNLRNMQNRVNRMGSMFGDLFSGNFRANMQRNLGALSEISQGIGNIGMMSMGAGAGIFGGMVMAAKTGLDASTEFSKSLAGIKSAVNGSAQDLTTLKNAALDLNTAFTTGLTPAEQAEAITELGKAGFITSQILGGALKGTLAMAAAEGMAVGEAATIANSSMNQFGLTAAKIPMIADTLASGAAASTASIKSLGDALNMVGLVAGGLTNQSLSQTVGVLAAFDQAGMKGSDAGTSLKTMLLNLNPKSAEAEQVMKKLNISFTTANGKFKILSQIAQELKVKMAGLSDAQRTAAMQTLFGTDAIRASAQLYKMGGAGVDEWTEKVSKAGEASRMMKDQLTGWAGSIKRLKALGSAVTIKFGDKLADKLNPMIDKFMKQIDEMVASGKMDKLAEDAAVMVSAVVEVLGKMGTQITQVIDWYSKLSDEEKDNITSMIASAPKYLIVGGAIAKIGSEIANLLIAFSLLRLTAPATAAALMGILGPAGAILGTVIAAGTVGWFLGNKIVDLMNTQDALNDAANNLTAKTGLTAKYGKGYGTGTGKVGTVHQWNRTLGRFEVVPANKANKNLTQTGVKASMSSLPSISELPRLTLPKTMPQTQKLEINGTFKVINGNLTPYVSDVAQTVVNMNR